MANIQRKFEHTNSLVNELSVNFEQQLFEKINLKNNKWKAIKNKNVGVYVLGVIIPIKEYKKKVHIQQVAMILFQNR
jgi:hypothetical protein